MVAASASISLYASRWKASLVALVCASGIAVDLLSYFVLPTPVVTAQPWAYQEPIKTIMHLFMLVVFGSVCLYGVYWTLTPYPLLRLSASGLVYRPFPRRTQAVDWDDVQRITAHVTRRTTYPFARITALTLWFTFKSFHPSTDSDGRTLSIEVNTWMLSRRPEELLRLIRTYHDVQWSQEEFNNARRAATEVTRRQRLRDYKRRQSS